MKSIERIAVGVLVFAVFVLTIVGLLGIWEILESDVIWKSLSTIGVIGFAALIIVGIARVIDMYQGRDEASQTPTITQ